MERNIRKLGEVGALRFERAREPTLVARRLEQFLELENAGWKGAAGTALLAKREDAAFARRAFATRHGDLSSVSIDTLLLGERPIAMCLSLQAGHTAFTVKTTYDEDYRSFSPGLTLEYFIIKAFYEDGSMQDMDAATTVEGHVVADLWNSAKDMGSIFVGPDDWRTRAMAMLDARAHGLRGFAKSVLKGPDGKIAAGALKVMSLLKRGRDIPRELAVK